MTKPTPEEVEKFKAQAKTEFGMDLTDQEAEEMLTELQGEAEAKDRR